MPIVTPDILSEGQKLPAEFNLLRLEVIREANRIPFAQLVLEDGNPSEGKFPLSGLAFFEPGKEIEIKLRYEGEGNASESVFKGLVHRHNLEGSKKKARLTVFLKDKAYAMTMGRKSQVFSEQSDADIIKSLIEGAGATAGTIPATEPTHPEIVQYYCSDWDFMLARAEVQNLLVTVKDGEVALQKLEVKSPRGKTHTYTYGISEIHSFEIEADAGEQYEKAGATYWDPKTQQMAEKSEAAAFSLQQTNLDGAKIGPLIGGKELLLSSAVALDPKEAKSWADGRLARSRLALYKGTISVAGFADIELLDLLQLEKFGARFTGTNLVTGLRHTVSKDNWETDIQFGLPATPYTQRPDIQDAPAAGLLPAVHGLQPGLVETLEEDPDGEFRVKVKLPGIDPDTGIVWARLAAPEAGKERGYFFRPEQGDEVVVGFFNDDPRQAVILGALFGSVNVPPPGMETFNAENPLKGIVSKTGIKMAIDDTAKTLTLLTSDSQSVVIDEQNKKITITDGNANSITLDSNGITLNAAGDFMVQASGDIKLNGANVTIGGADITLDGSGNATVNGSDIALNGSGNVKISGSAVDVQ